MWTNAVYKAGLGLCLYCLHIVLACIILFGGSGGNNCIMIIFIIFTARRRKLNIHGVPKYWGFSFSARNEDILTYFRALCMCIIPSILLCKVKFLASRSDCKSILLIYIISQNLNYFFENTVDRSMEVQHFACLRNYDRQTKPTNRPANWPTNQPTNGHKWL